MIVNLVYLVYFFSNMWSLFMGGTGGLSLLVVCVWGRRVGGGVISNRMGKLKLLSLQGDVQSGGPSLSGTY